LLITQTLTELPLNCTSGNSDNAIVQTIGNEAVAVHSAPSGSRDAVSGYIGSTVSVLDSVHSQAMDLMVQTRVLGSRKDSMLKAAKDLAASAEALRGRLRDIVKRLGKEARHEVGDVSSGAVAINL
jgi:hypothetical protein